MKIEQHLLQAIKTEDNLHERMVGDLEVLRQRAVELGGHRLARTISNALEDRYNRNI